MHPNAPRSTIHNSQDTETTYMSISRGMDKEDVVCAHTHTHTHTQWNITQPEKNKYILTHICGNYKNGIDELICKAKTDTQMERTNVWRLRWERGVGWIGRLELTYIHYYV